MGLTVPSQLEDATKKFVHTKYLSAQKLTYFLLTRKHGSLSIHKR